MENAILSFFNMVLPLRPNAELWGGEVQDVPQQRDVMLNLLKTHKILHALEKLYNSF